MMRSLIFIVTGWLLLVLVAEAQVQSIFESKSSNFSMTGVPDASRDLRGQFTFRKLPAALDTAIVDFSLELRQPIKGDSICIVVFNGNGYVKVLSDTIFRWVGRHKVGDKFSGTLSFVSYASGPGELVFTLLAPGGAHFARAMHSALGLGGPELGAC
jgi:hypothetical protein